MGQAFVEYDFESHGTPVAALSGLVAYEILVLRTNEPLVRGP